MVDIKIDDTDLFAAHRQPVHHHPKSQWGQWFKHFSYMPWRTKQYFNQQAQQRISQTVANAEQGHAGEIQVIIEGHLPLHMALKGNCQLRAKELFSHYGVWDTKYNSGMLLYINICARQVVILADRGINEFVQTDHWDIICQQIIQKLSKNAYEEGVLEGIQLIGTTLQQFYSQDIYPDNEIADNAIFL